MEDISNSLISFVAVVGLVIAAYQGAFGTRQAEISEVVIKAFDVKSRYKPAVNMATSIVVSLAVGGVLAMEAGWRVLPIAALAGFLASMKAAEAHDAKKAEKEPTGIHQRTLRRLP